MFIFHFLESLKSKKGESQSHVESTNRFTFIFIVTQKLEVLKLVLWILLFLKRYTENVKVLYKMSYQEPIK